MRANLLATQRRVQQCVARAMRADSEGGGDGEAVENPAVILSGVPGGFATGTQ